MSYLINKLHIWWYFCLFSVFPVVFEYKEWNVALGADIASWQGSPSQYATPMCVMSAQWICNH